MGERRADIFGFEIREIGQDLLLTCAAGQHIEHILNSDAHPADAGYASALDGIDRDTV
jgi:hypothetical protein